MNSCAAHYGFALRGGGVRTARCLARVATDGAPARAQAGGRPRGVRASARPPARRRRELIPGADARRGPSGARRPAPPTVITIPPSPPPSPKLLTLPSPPLFPARRVRGASDGCGAGGQVRGEGEHGREAAARHRRRRRRRPRRASPRGPRIRHRAARRLRSPGRAPRIRVVFPSGPLSTPSPLMGALADSDRGTQSHDG